MKRLQVLDILNFLGRVGMAVAKFLSTSEERLAPHLADLRRRLVRGKELAFPPHLQGVLKEVETREVMSHLPKLNERVLALVRRGEGGGTLPPLEVIGRPRVAVEIRRRVFGSKSSPSPVQGIVGTPSALPLKPQSVDFLIDGIDPNERNMTKNRWDSAFGVLKKGGRAILIAPHPFGPLAQGATVTDLKGFESYYQLFRQAGMGLGNVRELFADNQVKRTLNRPEDQALFERIKGKPLLIVFYITKL